MAGGILAGHDRQDWLEKAMTAIFVFSIRKGDEIRCQEGEAISAQPTPKSPLLRSRQSHGQPSDISTVVPL